MDDLIAKVCSIRLRDTRIDVVTSDLDIGVFTLNWWGTDHIIENATISIAERILTIKGTERFYYSVTGNDKVDQSLLDKLELPADSPCRRPRMGWFSKKTYYVLKYGIYLKKEKKSFSMVVSGPFTISVRE